MKEMKYIFTTLLLLLAIVGIAQVPFSIHGKIVDEETNEVLPYVSIQLPEANTGTRSDIDGNFFVETTKPITFIRVIYVGYTTKEVPVSPGRNEITVRLSSKSTELNTVEIKAGKRKKDKKAFDLVEEVFARKDQNRKEGLRSYSYEAYEKLQFDLNNITDRFRNRRSLRKFQFMFENVDTNRTTNKVALPVYLRERLTEMYYRRSPKEEKEYIIGEKQAGLKGYIDGDGVSAYLNIIYQPIDIYDNTINLLSSQFTGPLSGIAPSVYRFYIIDTVVYKGTPCADVFFAPRNKSDLAFMGNMLVALDSSYAVRRVQMGIADDINLNWVSNLYIDQSFDFVGEGENQGLMLTQDDISMDFQLLESEKGRSLLAHKSVSYQNHTINQPLPDSLFRPAVASVILPEHKQRGAEFWLSRRHQPLSKTESGIYRMVDSIQNVPAFRRGAAIANLLLVGYRSIGGFDLGPVNTFYSFNAVEGFRLRAGGRTNAKLAENLLFEGYLAYGFGDKQFKYFGGLTYAFHKQKPLAFPMNQLTVSYQKETQFPGEELQFIQDDNFLLSFRRGVNDKMFYNRTLLVEYVREIRAGLRYNFSFHRVAQSPSNALLFDYAVPDDTGNNTRFLSQLTTTQFGLSLRYAPNEKFYQGKTYRIPIANKFPIITLNYRAGVKGVLGGMYDFHSVNFTVNKIFYVSPIGLSDWTLEGGKTFGAVPYPLLEIHRANQSFAYQLPSYNLMNFLEFVSDRYIALNIQHHFGGVFFNKIPLLRRLKWREVVSFKGLYGGLSEENRPSEDNQLLRFPVDSDGRTMTRTLETQPYVEASVGISNIFRLFRLDYVRRMTYTDLPGVSKWGLRARFKIDF
jgi:Family of unknown function (DUF5686)/CarboxypepD_reg-like domain